jgi:hypothetical protein
VMPARLNSELLRLTEETVTLADVALRDAERLALVPTTTLPKATPLVFKASCPSGVPVPESEIFNCVFEASELSVRVPLLPVADCGAKATLNVTLCPDVSVTGNVRPLTLNPVPVKESCEMVALDPPVLVTVSDKDSLLPICTLPKVKLDFVGLKAPGAPTTPLPLSATLVGLFAASLEMATFPLTLPEALGEKTILNVTLWPTATVTGRAGWVSENSFALNTALVTVTAVAPVLLAAAVRVLLLPTVTLPNATDEAPGVRLPPDGVCWFELMPWHPASVSRSARTSACSQRTRK